MSYLPGIPLATDKPSQSQGQIKDNFTALNTIFGINHVKFDAATGNGEHTLVTINDVQAADPGAVDPKSALYTKDVSGIPQLFFQNSASVSQLSGLASVAGSPGYVTFPGGIRIAWGHATASSSTHILFAPAFPNACWVVTTAADSTHAYVVSAQGITKTGFFATATTGGTAFSYIAIGN